MTHSKGNEKEPSQLDPNAPIEVRIADVLGSYTLLLNGTTLEREANNGEESRKLHDEYRSEVVRRLAFQFKGMEKRLELAERVVEAAKYLVAPSQYESRSEVCPACGTYGVGELRDAIKSFDKERGGS